MLVGVGLEAMRVARAVVDWFGGQKVRRRRASNGDRGHALAMLREPGCPICSERRAQERRFFRWFPVDYYAEGWWVRRLAESGGFCRDHFWELIAVSGIPYQFSYVAQYLLAATRDGLIAVALAADANRSTIGRGRRLRRAICALQLRKRCPVCAGGEVWEGWAIEQLLAGLTFPEVGPALRASAGLCLPHLRQTLQQSDPTEVALLVEAHRPNLAAAAVGSPAIVNADHQLAALLYGDLGAKTGSPGADARSGRAAAVGTGWGEVAVDVLAGDECPVCRAVAAGLEECYSKLESVGRPGQVPLASLAGAENLCPAHAKEVVRRGGTIAIGPVWLGLAREALAGMALQARAAAKPGQRGLVPRWPHRGAPAGRSATAASCPACNATETLTDEALDRLLAALAEPRGRERYRASGGMCQTHLRAALERAPLPALRLLVEVQMGRLYHLDAELADYFHKSDYKHRDEPRGREQTAWLRAIALLVGGPPRA